MNDLLLENDDALLLEDEEGELLLEDGEEDAPSSGPSTASKHFQLLR